MNVGYVERTTLPVAIAIAPKNQIVGARSLVAGGIILRFNR